MNHKLEQLKTKVLTDVNAERIRQNLKWGIQRHEYGTWLAILMEEVGEAAQATQAKLGLVSSKVTDSQNLYKELIHVSAVAAAFAEQVLEEEHGNN